MEKGYYLLGPSENSRFIRIVRILFGLACITVAIFWMIFNIRSASTDRILWITILFLLGFGLYQIWAGMGRATRFIKISDDSIILKKNSLLPLRNMQASGIRKIEVFPLNLVFHLNSGRRTILRFGTTYTDCIDPVKTEIEHFADLNDIELEIINEEI